MKCLLTLMIIIVIIFSVDGQRRSRLRNRGRKGKGSCHLKELDECLNKLDKYSNNRNTSYLLTTERGLDEICTNSMDVANCLKNYMIKCATPLQKELYEFGMEQFIKYIDRFCKPGENRTRFLQHSPCINDKILLKNNYKEICVDGFLATVDKTKQFDSLDDRLDGICCSFNRWQDCLNRMITKQCGEEARKAMTDFLDGSFGGLTDLICNKKEFVPNSKMCISKYAEPGTKTDAKLSDNPITKYTASYFGFLFN